MRKSSSLTLRLAIFLYDCLRVFFLLALLAIAAGDPSGPGGMFQGAPDVIRFPHVLYAAPNALFPLMSLFLFMRPAGSMAFIPLYITGKAVATAALSGWVLFACLKPQGLPPVALLFLFLGAADVTSMAGMALFSFSPRKTAPDGAPAGGEGAE
ncbi:MAG: hypothetical protein LBI67_03705 [Treponema sp.]|jgi:hypothetical protein|nr:hypothetical protein [Treponema sp.]